MFPYCQDHDLEQIPQRDPYPISLFLKIPALYVIYIKKGELLLKISVRN